MNKGARTPRGRPKAQLILGPGEREALLLLAQCDNDPAMALRAKIIVACSDGLENSAVAQRMNITAHTVSKWRSRFLARRLEGLSDMPRSGAPRRIDDATIQAIVAQKGVSRSRTRGIRGVAREVNVSPSSVARIWRSSNRQTLHAGDKQHSSSGKGSNSPIFTTDVEPSKEIGAAPAHVDEYPLGDLAMAFRMAPVGLLVSRQRVIVSCNQVFSDTFGYSPERLAGRSLECLYPSHEEFQHIGERAVAVMRETGFYADERIMRKADGSLFWCHVSGRSINRSNPFAAAIWCFEDISAVRRVASDLTPREREVAQLLVTGRSSKHIARELSISHRTVEAHRARLMRKYGVTTTSELIGRLIGRH
ncbi:LuxR C-terminal-related transcriptional regulator [Paraburkholderia phenoliruptrix]|nr:LuxR C-terminal-related transcriptional regulator [Paraburkholderia phenoliruptrix]CAB4048584.1 hypothetical protein LMG9964_02225 [Paraburkholderia phenoliruptrix]